MSSVRTSMMKKSWKLVAWKSFSACKQESSQQCSQEQINTFMSFEAKHNSIHTFSLINSEMRRILNKFTPHFFTNLITFHTISHPTTVPVLDCRSHLDTHRRMLHATQPTETRFSSTAFTLTAIELLVHAQRFHLDSHRRQLQTPTPLRQAFHLDSFHLDSN